MWIRIDGEVGFYAMYSVGADTPEEMAFFTTLADHAHRHNKFSVERHGRDYPITWGSHWEKTNYDLDLWTPELGKPCNRLTAYWLLFEDSGEDVKFIDNPIFKHPLWVTHIQPYIERGELDDSDYFDYYIV